MNETGGAFLLQETQPTRLIGALMPGLAPNGVGWIQFSFASEPGAFSLSRHDHDVSGSMSRAIGMALISVLRVLLAQIRWLQSANGIPPVADIGPSEGPLHFKIDRNVILFAWNANNSEVTLRDVKGETELRVSERFAGAFVSNLEDALGHFAIGDSP